MEWDNQQENVIFLLIKMNINVIITLIKCNISNEVNRMGLSEDIKRIRRKAFMTQEEFAKEIGVSFGTVNRWETGKARPNLKAMKAIDEYCKRNSIDFDISEKIE